MKESKSIDFIFEVMRMKLDHYLDASNALDQKISVLTGFLATIIAGLAGFFGSYLHVDICKCSFNLFVFGVFFIVIALLTCILALSTKKYSYPPAEDNLYCEESLNTDIIELKNQTMADMKASFKHNCRMHEEKALLFNFSLWMSFIGLLLVLANFI